MEFAADALLTQAIDLHRSGDGGSASKIYRRLLDDAAGRQWLSKCGALELVYSNLVLACFSGQSPGQAVETFSEYVEVTGQADPDFDPLYLEALRRTGTNPAPFQRRKRLRELVRIFRLTRQVTGSIAECGCFRGLSSYLLLRAKRLENTADCNYLIFDSFEGLSDPLPEDDIDPQMAGAEGLRIMTRRGHFAADIGTVQAALADFPQVEIHPGWIPDSFKGVPEQTYRFVHVDVDLYAPTLASFTYFYARLSSGGCIISDDYNWPGAKKAISQFCEEHDLRLQVTDFDQAFLFKK